jgi:pimeloyl-ACP methyl ester carboxylesterase
MTKIAANGIELEYEETGDKSAPAMFLIHGLGAQLTLWPQKFVDQLAAAGFRVIRYDNRDIGLSTKFESYGIPDLGALTAKAMAGEKIPAPYYLSDMARDGIGLMDALGIERAHVVGVSMGGMIVQTMAIEHPERLLSMTSIMSTSGRRGLPPGKPEAVKMLMSAPPNTERETLITHSMKVRRAIGSPAYPMDDAALRALVERNVDRSYYPQGVARQYNAVMASGSRSHALPSITTPSLVIHGADDPLLVLAAGEDTAKLIPGAQLKVYPGMGHDLPTALIPDLVATIAAHAQTAVAGLEERKRAGA